ncbi:uncharacterized protein MELLADRAFT_89740 [Melampsora larici-populina 98AG31]|uniref:Uncharacterized protein n=1 Tax=Melampsora larici-populina (strain 98AG31 / pathotype 3-4-7) TaxID=747676 RepID=F4RUF9_MELLP|nr:uncharacterized protein MELLADRAFT_89740 [Melampsora larici-populina 98AG31]EGG03927.1 hypothetical protein MELLADRAFT_89740 [Melampsora larici-populina 98AG31]
MDEAVRAAAECAANITVTWSKSVALGQPPCPPLEPTRQTVGRPPAPPPIPQDDIDEVPLENSEIEDLLEDTGQILQGPIIKSDDDNNQFWRPPVEKGKGRAYSNTSPTPSDFSRPNSEGGLDALWSCGAEHIQVSHITGGWLTTSLALEKRPVQDKKSTQANKRADLLYAAGHHMDGEAVLNQYFQRQEGSVINKRGERVPAASSSGLARSHPYNLLAEDLLSASDSTGNIPFMEHQSRESNCILPARTVVDPLLRRPDSKVDPRIYNLYTTWRQWEAPRQPEVPTTYKCCSSVLRQYEKECTRVEHARQPPTYNTRQEPPNSQQPNLRSQANIEEEEQVKFLMASKRGRLVLRKGDVVENSRYLVADESDEMEKGLNQLSSVLTHWLRTFKSYIPLTAFNKLFLAGDQAKWSRRKAPTESKIEDRSSSLRVHGGSPPPDKLLMQFKGWINTMTLFIRYVADAGWQTLKERFEGHRTVVIDLREHYGWIIALRYCIRIRQGVMRDTIDGKIKNFSNLQSAIFEEVQIVADSRQQKAYHTNPYANGGPLSSVNPMTGLPRKSPSTTAAKKWPLESSALKTVKSELSSADWIPSLKWRTMTAEEKAEAKRFATRNTYKPDDERGQGKDRYQDQDNYRDRGRDYKKRSCLRSHSPRGSKGRGKACRQLNSQDP